VGRSNSLSGIRHWMDSDVERAERAFEIWRGNVNRVKGVCNWLVFKDRRGFVKSLLRACRSAFVSINLDPDFDRCRNLRQLGVIFNGSNKIKVVIDVERMNQFFMTRSLPQNELDFDIPVRLGVPEFLFITVDSQDVFDAFMAVKLDASGLDGIPLSFAKCFDAFSKFYFLLLCVPFQMEVLYQFRKFLKMSNQY
jgi:hypothetical protein